MPAALTHYLQVERVVTGLKKLHSDFEYNKNAMLWGAQGPDFILSHRGLPGQTGPSIKKCGAYLQDEDINNLRAMILKAAGERLSTVMEKSYIIGFLCHSILDRCALPFINYSAKILEKLSENKSLKVCRNHVKSTLDVIILRYEKNQLPTEIRLRDLLPQDEKVEAFMRDFFCRLLNENYETRVTPAEISEAMCDFRKFFGLMTDRTGIKKGLVQKIEKWRGKDEYMSSFIRDLTEDDSYDYANIAHSEWSWPMDSDATRTDTFFEIYEQSIVDSISFVDKLFWPAPEPII